MSESVEGEEGIHLGGRMSRESEREEGKAVAPMEGQPSMKGKRPSCVRRDSAGAGKWWPNMESHRTGRARRTFTEKGRGPAWHGCQSSSGVKRASTCGEAEFLS